jgi:hypothetical protein
MKRVFLLVGMVALAAPAAAQNSPVSRTGVFRPY